MTKIFRLDVELEVASYSEIAASTSFADPEFDELVINILEIFSRYGFDIVEEHESSRSNTSYYCTLIKHSEITSDEIRCVFFARISDHSVSRRRAKQRANYYSKEAQKYNKTEGFQPWKFINLVINGDRFNSIDDGLHYVETRVASL